MTRLGSLVELEASDGKEAELAAFLREAKALVDDEPGTLMWFAFQRGPRSFGIFDVFSDETAREVHLHGEVRRALEARGPAFLRSAPVITPVDIGAWKLPGSFSAA
jgi:quinol monooxygenase YgiN